MRLINTQTLDLEEFYGNQIPRYAILSHTWVQRQEVTYQEWLRKDADASVRAKSGFAKILGARELARDDGHDWLWVDTNCIDKTSSAELSEAINSMYEWYSRSEICYAYLSDVSNAPNLNSKYCKTFGTFFRSRWWTRGWTLQELLAPKELLFFTAKWEIICSRQELALRFREKPICGIDVHYLIGHIPPYKACVSEKMSWLSTRETTRDEDMAYCMMGLFQINMPLLYGEGRKAFWRLQEEIIRVSNDHTIFCWSWTNTVPDDWVSMLAPWPDTFADSGDFKTATSTSLADLTPYSMTNVGLSIQFPVIYTTTSRFACLDVGYKNRSTRIRACVNLLPMKREGNGHYRSRLLTAPIPLLIDTAEKEGGYAIERLHHFMISLKAPTKFPFLLWTPPKPKYNVLLFVDPTIANNRSPSSGPHQLRLPLLEGSDRTPDFHSEWSSFDLDEGTFGLAPIDHSSYGGLWSWQMKGQISEVLIIFVVKHAGTVAESWHCRITVEDDISQPSIPKRRRKARVDGVPAASYSRETWFKREFRNLLKSSIDGAVSATNDGTLRLQVGDTLSTDNNTTIKSAALLSHENPSGLRRIPFIGYNNYTDPIVAE